MSGIPESPSMSYDGDRTLSSVSVTVVCFKIYVCDFEFRVLDNT